MPEQMAFARKASGLVRGLSMMDAFGVGFMNQGLTPSMWVMISLGLGVYLDDFSQMKHLPPAKQFRTDVRLMRYRYTMSYHIAPVVELYEKVLT